MSLLAKTPTPGRVKTRLQGRLDPDRAARVAEGLLHASVHNACSAWPGPVELVVWPDAGHRAFRDLAARYPIGIRRQATGHLGHKMLRAVEHGIRVAGAGAVMGIDIPHCPGAVLCEAAAALCRGENVIGATRDGGFYLLGLTRVRGLLLNGVHWGSADVFRETVARLDAAGIKMEHQLPVLRDIDTWEDLQFALGRNAWLREYVGAAMTEGAGRS